MRYTYKQSAERESRLLSFAPDARRAAQERRAMREAAARDAKKKEVAQFPDLLQRLEDVELELDALIDETEGLGQQYAVTHGYTIEITRNGKVNRLVIPEGMENKRDTVLDEVELLLMALHRRKDMIYDKPHLRPTGKYKPSGEPIFEDLQQKWAKKVNSKEEDVDPAHIGIGKRVVNFSRKHNLDTLPDNDQINTPTKRAKYETDHAVAGARVLKDAWYTQRTNETFDALIAHMRKLDQHAANEATFRMDKGLYRNAKERERTQDVTSHLVANLDKQFVAPLQVESDDAYRSFNILSDDGLSVDRDSIDAAKKAQYPEGKYRKTRRLDADRFSKLKQRDKELEGLPTQVAAVLDKIENATKKMERIAGEGNPMAESDINLCRKLPEELSANGGPLEFLRRYRVTADNPAVRRIDTVASTADRLIREDLFLNAAELVRKLKSGRERFSEKTLDDAYGDTEKLQGYKNAGLQALARASEMETNVEEVDASQRKNAKRRENISTRRESLLAKINAEQSTIRTEIVGAVNHLEELALIEAVQLSDAKEAEGNFERNYARMWEGTMSVEDLKKAQAFRAERIEELQTGKSRITARDHEDRPLISKRGADMQKEIDTKIAKLQRDNVEIGDGIALKETETTLAASEKFHDESGLDLDEITLRVEDWEYDAAEGDNELIMEDLATLRDTYQPQALDHMAALGEARTHLQDRLDKNPESRSADKIRTRIGELDAVEAALNMQGIAIVELQERTCELYIARTEVEPPEVADAETEDDTEDGAAA